MKKQKPFVRSQWHKYRSGIDCQDKEGKLTKDSFEPMTSAAYIIDRFKRTGILPESETPEYGVQEDTTLFDRQVALTNLKNSFSRLPAEEQAKHGDAFTWLEATATGLLDDGQAIDLGDEPSEVLSQPPADQTPEASAEPSE